MIILSDWNYNSSCLDAIFSMISNFDVVIVGSGFFGATIAERITTCTNKKVLVLDSRSHLGGNAYSTFHEETRIEYHKYGSHIFHTDNKKVWDYCNKFTKFNNYRHKVFSIHNEKVFSLPINLSTINQFYQLNLSPKEAEIKIKPQMDTDGSATNLESKAISLIGEVLYNAFIKNYTIKQWQKNPTELPAEIITRLPVRFNYNTDYFDDLYQGIPLDGYTKWIEKMLSKSTVLLNTDFFDLRSQINPKQIVIYTGPIDKYFSYIHGELTWRTLDFDLEVVAVEDFQGTSVMNYSDLDVNFTRIHEFKHLHPEREYPKEKTLIMREFSRLASSKDEPYYPVNLAADREKLVKYREMIKLEKNTFFGGRLGSYQYLDMHMAIASALGMYENKLVPILNKE
jgi:UDP-galactopyranose mutase